MCFSGLKARDHIRPSAEAYSSCSDVSPAGCRRGVRAHEKRQDGWLSVELSLLSQLPPSELSVHTSSLWSGACMSVLRVCVRACACLHHMLQSPAAHSFWSHTDGQTLEETREILLSRANLYTWVRHKRRVIYCRLGPCCNKPRVAGDVICQKYKPGLWGQARRKLTTGDFFFLGCWKWELADLEWLNTPEIWKYLFLWSWRG